MVLGPSGGGGAEFGNSVGARCVLRFGNSEKCFLARRNIFLRLKSTRIPECANPYVFQGLRSPPGAKIHKSAKSAPGSNFLQKYVLLAKSSEV